MQANYGAPPAAAYPPQQQPMMQQQPQGYAPVPVSMPAAQQPGYPPQQQYAAQVDMQAAGGNTHYMAGGQYVQAPYAPAGPAMGRVDSGNALQAAPGGKLIVDVPVPAQLADQFSRNDPEFRTLRYTACTSDPNNFVKEGFSIRQTGKETELFIVVTMYNEGPKLFIKTMQGVHNNIRQMLKQKEWGADGWKKIVVAIVSDGRTKINKDTLTLISMMGCYQEGLMRQYVNGKKTQAHIFEVTTEMNWEGMPEDGTQIVTHKNAKKGVIPMQLLFCLKEANAKKINSHRWFFNAFAASIKPNVCVLLDVGTKPQSMSIYRLWRAFLNKQVGGACGEIAVEGSYLSMLNPIIAGQNFEYKMSNILDKPLESVFGYISVLPGAFSAYRYAALEGHPLQEYFKGETLHDSGDIFTSNMYLAEDRILCFELVAKANCNWILRYEKNSQAVTDAPDNFPEFISQRRRWLNGSTFAFLYAFGNMGKFFTSGQSIFRKIGIFIELCYSFINFLFAYLSLAHFFISFRFLRYLDLMKNKDSLTLKLVPTETGSPVLYQVVSSILKLLSPIYILAICITFIASLGNKPQSARRVFGIAIGLFAIISGTMLVLIIISTWVQFQINPNVAAKVAQFKIANVTKNDSGTLVVLTLVSLAGTYGVFFVSSFLYLEWYHIIFNIIQYTLLLPTYVNVLQIYAYCNISDLSWGTKGDTGGAKGGSGGGSGGNNGQPKDELAEIAMAPANDFYTKQNARFTAMIPEMQKEEAHSKSKDDKEDNFKKFRTIWLLIWTFVNGVLLAALLSPQTIGIDPVKSKSFQNLYLLGLSLCVLILTLFRFCGSLVYWVGHLIGCC
ncbi:Chitin synthase, class 1 [Allomyces arbusculus]|nr:Chitin synthase, class 1 [Allomyces arbusculus]